MTDDRRPDTDALIGAWALDALSDDERALIESRLAESDDLRAEATELADTAVRLGLAVAPEAPPASLKASVLAAIDGLPQQSAPRVLQPVPPIADQPETEHARHVAGPAEQRAARRWYTRPMTVALAAVAALVVVAGGVVGINTLAPAAQQQAAFDRIVDAADAESASVETADGATATLHWSTDLAAAALVVDGMDAPPAGSVYELWLIDEHGTATPAGLFTPSNGSHTAVLAGSYDDGDTIGVTVEPEGGSDSPTSDPIMAIATA